jgi:hypothetical protein
MVIGEEFSCGRSGKADRLFRIWKEEETCIEGNSLKEKRIEEFKINTYHPYTLNKIFGR